MLRKALAHDWPTILVIAKAPVPGRVKTRLCPPCTPEQAAELAQAALRTRWTPPRRAARGRRVLVLDGAPGAWLPGGFEVVAQRGDGLAERLADAFEDAGEPALLVGMDTPQVTPALLDAALEALAEGIGLRRRARRRLVGDRPADAGRGASSPACR